MKNLLLITFTLSTLLAGCVSPAQQQATAAQSNFEFCKKMAKSGEQRAAIAAHLFPKFENIDVVMMSDRTYPSLAELEAAKPYFRDRLSCNRKLIADIEQIRGVSSTSQMLANAKRFNGNIENSVAKFLSGDMTYGAYFTSLRNLSSEYQERHTGIARAEEQAAYEQRMRAYQNAVNGMSEAFKNTPCIGCGLSPSPSGTKAPPGNKTCSYKSGPYQWTKTISGFTCPPTDSSNGYFGTLVR